MLEPIGIATIDLLVCAFIALVVLNILRQQDVGLERKTPPTPEIVRIEAPKGAGIDLSLQIGNKWWPKSHGADVKQSKLPPRDEFDDYMLILTLPKNSGPVTLFVAYTTKPKSPDEKIRISYLSTDSTATPISLTKTLGAAEHYRLKYVLRTK